MKNHTKWPGKPGIAHLLIASVLFLTCSSVSAEFVWKQKADFGGGNRDMAFGFSIGNYGYAGAGRNVADKNDFWQYDPNTDSWTQMADYPGMVRTLMVGFSIGNLGYAGIGWTNNSNLYKDWWSYDPGSNTWTQKATFAGHARYAAVGFAIGNKGYVGTGYSPFSNDFWEYDPANDSWTQKTNVPGPVRLGAVGFGIGAKGYVGGGYSNGSHFNDFYEYDPANDSWTNKSKIPGLRRRNAVAFVIDNMAYVGTGYNDSTYMTDFYQYNPILDNWTTVASIGGIPRYTSFAFSINNIGYVGTGCYYNPNIPVLQRDFWSFESCADITNGISMVDASNKVIDVSVKYENYRGLVVKYDLVGEGNSVLKLYDAMGKLITSFKLYEYDHIATVPVTLSKSVYLYSVTRGGEKLDAGKVTVQ